MSEAIPGNPTSNTLQARIARYADAARVKQALLLDMQGHILASAGSAARDDATLGALLAGMFSSARHLADLLGERDFPTFFQQGLQTSIFTMRVGAQWLLVTVFGRQTQIGLVRMLATETASDLAAALANLSFAQDVHTTVQSVAFRASFDDTLERLFQDDSISANKES